MPPPPHHLACVHLTLHLTLHLPFLTRTQLASSRLHLACISPASRLHLTVRRIVHLPTQALVLGDVRLGGVVRPTRPELVPAPLFYDSPQHLSVMRSLLQDWQLGHHLLLIGNQGVGKNKLTDRLLQLMRREREYMQLHRDTTVSALTQVGRRLHLRASPQHASLRPP